MKPFKIDTDGVPVFSNLDIDDYGFPELWGYEVYRVEESREKIFVSDYKMEQQYDLRPIHRYSRLLRFKTTLFHLIGERGIVSNEILELCAQAQDWEGCRLILKSNGFNKDYNKIPYIMYKLGRPIIPRISSETIQRVILGFMAVSVKYEQIKTRRYFPNLRFIVFKLLALFGIQINAPMIRTERKRKSLEMLWNELLCVVNKK